MGAIAAPRRPRRLPTRGRAAWATLVVASLTSVAVSWGSTTAVTVKELTQGLASTPNPGPPTAGPDGNVWFTDHGAVGRVTPAGVITEFAQGIPAGDTPSDSITAGSDGALWFCLTGASPAIGRIDPATGAITSFPLQSNPQSVIEGPDGNVWFMGGAATPAIGYITPAGAVTEITTGFTTSTPSPEAIAAGGDGNIWFLDIGSPYSVGHVNLHVTPHTISETNSGVNPANVLGEITAGPDGNVWFTASEEIGKVTLPAGTVTETDAGNGGLAAGAEPDEIMVGPDQNVWFDDQQNTAEAIGRIVPSSGAITEFPLKTMSTPWTMAFGVDGNLYVDQTGLVAEMTTAGAVTEFPTPSSMAGMDGDSMLQGPDGNLYYNDSGTPVALAQVNLHEKPLVTTGAASAVTASTASVAGSVTPLTADTTVSVQYGPTTALGSAQPAGTLRAGTSAATVTGQLANLPSASTIYYEVTATNANGTSAGAMQSFTTAAATGASPPPQSPSPHLTTGQIDGRQLTLSTPSATTCLAATTDLGATLSATTSAARPHTQLASAAFRLDRGVKHVHHRTVTKHGRRRIVTTTTYTPNAVAHTLPATVSLPLAALRSGAHALNVIVTVHRVRPAGKHPRVAVDRKTLTARFTVC